MIMFFSAAVAMLALLDTDVLRDDMERREEKLEAEVKAEESSIDETCSLLGSYFCITDDEIVLLHKLPFRKKNSFRVGNNGVLRQELER